MVKRDNHYVPHSYLKQWSDGEGLVWSYRTLVPHENDYLWKPRSPKSIGFQQHLYTQVVAGGETDSVENWFEAEIETPAAGALQRVAANAEMHPGDWAPLIRYLAAQDVRTPARMAERFMDWRQTLPTLLQHSLQQSVGRLEAVLRKGKKLPRVKNNEELERFPARAIIEPVPRVDHGTMHLEATVGRSLWLWSLKRLLTTTFSVLNRHQWTILRPPEGLLWLTSDNPVVCLNYHSDDNYDFKGGWASPGTEIFMPLSPTHLMYTQVGANPLASTVADLHLAGQLQRFTIEHAHRYVFSRAADRQVALWRPRVVDSAAFRTEAAQWAAWHKEQSEAEEALIRGRSK